MPLSQEESKKLKKTATAASVALAVSLSLLKMFGALSVSYTHLTLPTTPYV